MTRKYECVSKKTLWEGMLGLPGWEEEENMSYAQTHVWVKGT